MPTQQVNQETITTTQEAFDPAYPPGFELTEQAMQETVTAGESLYENEEIPFTSIAPTPEPFGSVEFGENDLGFPADMPIPASWEQIPVPPALEAQGYAIAYTFDGFAEEALRDLLAVMLPTPAWIVDEVKPQAYASTFVQPFGNMSTGFVAYAFITSTPEAIEMDSIDGTVIALHTGRYE